MNSVKALTELMRSLSANDLQEAHEDEVAALSMQLPRLSRRLVEELRRRDLLETPQNQSLSSLLGGAS